MCCCFGSAVFYHIFSPKHRHCILGHAYLSMSMDCNKILQNITWCFTLEHLGICIVNYIITHSCAKIKKNWKPDAIVKQHPMQGPTGQNAEMDIVTLSTVMRIAFKFLSSSWIQRAQRLARLVRFWVASQARRLGQPYSSPNLRSWSLQCLIAAALFDYNLKEHT